jgi:predicted nucleic acid-binding Zn ribbon protein
MRLEKLMTTEKQREKVQEVMHEFKEGDLHIGKSGKAVKNPKQAIAIAMSESGQSRSDHGRGGKKSSSHSKKSGH